MRLTTAILCDFATVREGLLHVLGGGVTRLWREQLPAPLNVTIAMMLEVEQQHLGSLIEVGVVIKDVDDERIIEARGAVQSGPGRLERGEMQLVPMAIPLVGGPATEKYGKHTVEFTVNGRYQSLGLTFYVLHPDEKALPSL